MEKAISFRNSNGQKLSGVLHIPAGNKKVPSIIYCHGFNGNKIEKNRIAVRLARELCNAGFAVLRFDFSGHGESEGDFDDISIVQELDDLECAITFLEKQPAIDMEKIGIVGHSLGGEIAILEAAKNASIKSLVLLAPVVYYKEICGDFPESMAKADKSGFVERASHIIKKQYFDEIRKFAPLEEIKKIKVPVLVIHGDADETVNLGGSKELIRRANEPKKLIIINGADHNFVGYDNTMRVISEIVSWFLVHLK